jgi:hypothetical protein
MESGLHALTGMFSLHIPTNAPVLRLLADQGKASAQFRYGMQVFHGDGISMDNSPVA